MLRYWTMEKPMRCAHIKADIVYQWDDQDDNDDDDAAVAAGKEHVQLYSFPLFLCAAPSNYLTWPINSHK